MKRAVTLFLCLVTLSVGLWVTRASHTLSSACTLSAQSGGAKACVSGVPFYLLGIALTATGVVSMMIALWASIGVARSKSTRREHSAISTLHRHEDDSLRDVA